MDPDWGCLISVLATCGQYFVSVIVELLLNGDMEAWPKLLANCDSLLADRVDSMNDGT